MDKVDSECASSTPTSEAHVVLDSFIVSPRKRMTEQPNTAGCGITSVPVGGLGFRMTVGIWVWQFLARTRLLIKLVEVDEATSPQSLTVIFNTLLMQCLFSQGFYHSQQNKFRKSPFMDKCRASKSVPTRPKRRSQHATLSLFQADAFAPRQTRNQVFCVCSVCSVEGYVNICNKVCVCKFRTSCFGTCRYSYMNMISIVRKVMAFGYRR